MLSGKYKYYVTFANGNLESRPEPGGRVAALEQQRGAAVRVSPRTPRADWTTRRIYRSVNDPPGDTTLYMVDEIMRWIRRPRSP